MTEMAPARIRGAVVSAKEAMIVSGIVAGYAIGNILMPSSEDTFSSSASWVQLYMVSLAISVPSVGLAWMIPRSVRWLLLQGHHPEAYESIKFIYRGDNVRQEFQTVADATTDANQSQTLPSTTSSPFNWSSFPMKCI